MLKAHLSFPFQTAPLLLVGSFTVGLILVTKAGLFGLPLGIIIISWFFKYCFALLDALVAGDEEPPVLSAEVVNPVDEQRPLAATALVLAQAWLVWQADAFAGKALAVPLALLLLFTLPASLAVLGITRSALKAAWPGAWVTFMRGLRGDYIWLLVAVLASGASIYGLWHFDVPLWLTVAATQMLFLIIFTLIGGAAHARRLELGIATLSRTERAAARDARDLNRDRRRMLDQAYAQLRLGKPSEAWRQLESWLGAPGTAFAERRIVLEAVSAWEDPRIADRLANDCLGLLLAARDNGQALALCELSLARNPKFRPTHAARLAELASLAGKRALRRQLDSN